MAYRSCGSSRRLMYPPDLGVGGIRLTGVVRIAPGFRCTGVASVGSVPARSPGPRVRFRDAEAILLLALAIPSAAIDWRIAQTWSWPAALIALWLGGTALAIVAGVIRPQFGRVVSMLAIVSLYAVPVMGAIIRWHLAPSTTALIGDGPYQTQLAGDFLLRGLDPYGADYSAAGDTDLPRRALVLAALLVADRRRYLLMGLLLGLAVVPKQHALLAVPLVATWAVVRGADFRGLIRAAGVAAIAGLAVVAPFVV